MVKDLANTVSQVDPTLIPVLIKSIEGAKAPATMRAYKGAMANLRAYATSRGLDPACPSSLLIYSLRKIEEGRSISTLRVLSSAFCHFSDPLPSTFAHFLSNLHESTRRRFTVSHHGSVPRSHIDSLVQYSLTHCNDVIATRTALGAAISFAALLRVGELLSLKWDDLQWSPSHLKVSVQKAKNDQFCEGRNTFISIDNQSPVLSLFRSYKDVVPHSPFVFPSFSHPHKPLSQDSFRHDLTLLCTRAGVPRITPHQLRAGGVMESIRQGAPLESVQRRGRWRSLGGLAPYIEDTVDSQGGALPLS